MKLNNTLTQSQLKAVIKYNPDSGEFIWTKRISIRISVGDIAGIIHLHGYRYITVFGERYKAARLAWLYMTGEWPKLQIDHINRIRSDDRFCNLRQVTNAENQQNRSLNKDGTISNIQGVYLTKNSTYMARLKHQGKYVFRKNFKTLEEAKNAIIEARQKYHINFNEI
jgi:hypothetical protein